MMKLAQDPELLDRFRRGEPAALEAVYLHYAPRLYLHLQQGFSFSSQGRWFRVQGVRDVAAQESLVQESFVRCFAEKARLSYDGVRPFWPYLQRTCERLLVGQERRDKRLLPLTDEAMAKMSHTDQASAQHELEQQELLVLLNAYLATCEEREQAVFQALYEHGDSQQEAADRLGLGRMQIRTSLSKIRTGLVRFLRDSGYMQRYTKESLPQSPLGALLLWLGQYS